MGRQKLNLTGQCINQLTVIKEDLSYIPKKFERKWICKCSCGTVKSITQAHLVKGTINSCGCARFIYLPEDKRLLGIWHEMKQRCSNVKRAKAHLYVLKGIRVCEEWLSDFNLFKEWAISNGYAENLTIDRIDSDKDYCPENCRWATRTTQSRNRKPNKQGSSKYIGVSWSSEKQKWVASISIANKPKLIGRFILELDAAKARDNFIVENSLKDFTMNF